MQESVLRITFWYKKVILLSFIKSSNDGFIESGDFLGSFKLG
jgi:hypothetical protein